MLSLGDTNIKYLYLVREEVSYTLRALLVTVCIEKPTRIIAISLCKYKTILFGAKSCLAFWASVTVPGEGR